MSRATVCSFLLALTATVASGADDVATTYPGLVRDGRLIPAVAGYLGKDLRTIALPMDAGLFARRANFGYTAEEVKRYFSAPLRITLDATGLDRRLLGPPPAAGIHPRVLFNAEDLPAIRTRLTTVAGKAAMDGIRAHIAATLTGPKAKLGAEWQQLIAGQPVADLATKPDLPYTIVYEAFRCLVDEDTAGGKQVAAALTTVAGQVSQRIDEEIAKAKAKFVTEKEKFAKTGIGAPPIDQSNDFNTVALNPTFQGTLGLDYDFAHGWMTEDQRKVVRAVLAKATRGMTNIGCETPRAFHSGLSNHIPWENRMIEAVTAIEGEEGYDASTYERCVAAQTNFISSIYASGEAFEGWAKNFLCIEHLIVMGKRGNDLVACARMRSVFNDYYLAAMMPWGGGFTFCDSLGGSNIKVARNADAVMYHTLFPDDVAGDLVLHAQVGGDPTKILGGAVNTHHAFAVTDALYCALFASDPSTKDFPSGLKKATEGRPLTYFSEDTCNTITRSGWDQDALYLNYLNRAVPGGHVYADRSHFSLYAQGRTWSIYQGSRQVKDQYGPVMRSLLLMDNEGPSILEGRCVAQVDKPLATFAVTDISESWNYQNNYVVRAPKGTTLAQHHLTYNHFRLHPSAIPWMDLPISQLPHWESANKPDPTFHADWYQRPVPVQKAFRTVGLVRGAHPYALVVDDLQRDAQPHAFDWTMVLPADVVLGSTTASGTQADIVLDEMATAKEPRDRHLLVRVLQATGLKPEAPANVGLTAVANPPLKDMQVNKLHIPATAVSPDFKVLLFPHRTGQPLPATTWSADQRSVTVAWTDQADVLTFTAGKDGRTRVKVARQGGEAVAVE